MFLRSWAEKSHYSRPETLSLERPTCKDLLLTCIWKLTFYFLTDKCQSLCLGSLHKWYCLCWIFAFLLSLECWHVTTIPALLWTGCLCLPKFHILKFYHTIRWLEGGAFGSQLGHKGGAFMNGVNALTKEILESSLTLFNCVRIQQSPTQKRPLTQT